MNSRAVVVVLLALWLSGSGCAVLSDRRVAAGCQVADGATTYYALTHGAVETNGLIAGISPAGILLFKFALAYIVYKLLPDAEHATKPDKMIAGAITLIGCVPAVHNLQVIRSLK